MMDSISDVIWDLFNTEMFLGISFGTLFTIMVSLSAFLAIFNMVRGGLNNDRKNY